MTHLAMLEVDDKGNSVRWGEHVSDEEYGQQSMSGSTHPPERRVAKPTPNRRRNIDANRPEANQ
jgi:hypothetical protein